MNQLNPQNLKAALPDDDYEQWKQAEIQAGLDDYEAGKWVDGDKVIEWLRSWGTEDELPPPL